MDERRPCLEWPNARNDKGYGQRWDNGRVVYVHRWVMAQIHGWEALEGQEVMHSCDNPPCFLYEHLSIGTKSDNQRDSWNKGRGYIPEPLRGSANHNSRLTEQAVREIKLELAAGVGTTELGRRYGVSHKTIERIREGRSWGWLNDD